MSGIGRRLTTSPAEAATAAPRPGTARVRGSATGAPDTFASSLEGATEQLKAIRGRAYSRIESGPCAGMYVNTSGNAREGLAFTKEYRDGQVWHVYGTKGDREVFVFPAEGRPAGEASASSAPVEGASARGRLGGAARGRALPSPG